MRASRHAVFLTLTLLPAAGCAALSGLSDFQKDDCADAPERCADASGVDGTDQVDGAPPLDGARSDSGRSDSGIDAPAPPGDAGADVVVSADSGDSGCTLCSGACVDETKDPKNCGACGHDCLGATCSGSLCQPLTLAAGETGAYDLELDATNVYFTTNTTASRVPKAGGAVVDLASAQNNPAGIAIDATNAYFVENAGAGHVKSIPLGAVNGTPVDLGSSPSGLYVATDGVNVYWTNGGNNSTVQAAPVTPGATRTLASGQSFPYAIATDGTSAYWGTFANNDGLWRVPVGGGTPTNFVPKQSNAINLVIDGTNVYWVEYGANGDVKQSPLGGGMGTVIASGSNSPFALTVDASFVYFGSLDGVFKVPIGGGTVTKIAADTGSRNLANDGAAIYWASTASSGSIVKLAK